MTFLVEVRQLLQALTTPQLFLLHFGVVSLFGTGTAYSWLSRLRRNLGDYSWSRRYLSQASEAVSTSLDDKILLPSIFLAALSSAFAGSHFLQLAASFDFVSVNDYLVLGICSVFSLVPGYPMFRLRRKRFASLNVQEAEDLSELAMFLNAYRVDTSKLKSHESFLQLERALQLLPWTALDVTKEALSASSLSVEEPTEQPLQASSHPELTWTVLQSLPDKGGFLCRCQCGILGILPEADLLEQAKRPCRHQTDHQARA